MLILIKKSVLMRILGLIIGISTLGLSPIYPSQKMNELGREKWLDCIQRFDEINQMPYICESIELVGTWGCGDSIYWGAVQGKEKAIPYLIEKISDSTLTEASVPFFGGNYTVGDIAYTALGEIIDGIPTFELMPVEFNENGCGYCSYWRHLRESHENRVSFKEAVANWYSKNKNKLEWVEGNRPLSCDCWFPHPNNGYFSLIKEK